MSTLKSILEKYYLEPDMKLVNHQESTKAVNCWFENDTIRSHRCLSNEDFETIKPLK